MARTATVLPPDKAAAPPKLDEPGLWYCNWKIWLEARRLLDRALAPLELRSREYWLLALAGLGNFSQHEIAGQFGLDPSSLVALLDALERRGLLRRERNPNDRRVQWVKRTEEGERLFARALPRARRAEARQLAALSADDQTQLVAAMRKLINISKQQEKR
jgi:DNA-binding MarR family transcriptional regulator